MRRTPPSGAGWIMLAAAAAPLVVAAAKPLAKKLGEGMVKLGEKIKEASERDRSEEPAATKAEPPKAGPATSSVPEAQVEPQAEAAQPKPRSTPKQKPIAKKPAPRPKKKAPTRRPAKPKQAPSDSEPKGRFDDLDTA